MKNLKTWSDLIAKWIAIGGAFAGGTFAMVQYSEEQQADRVKSALEYVHRLDKEPLHKARLSLAEYWNPKTDQVFGVAKGGEKELYEFIDSSFRQGKLESPFIQLLGFYENVRTCTCANICDEEVVRRFIGKEAYDLYGLSFPYIAEQRKRLHDPSFGTGLELLARNHKNEAEFLPAYCSGLHA